MLDIVKAPNPVLSQKAEFINKIDNSVLKIIDQMKEALLCAKDPIGVGLAAPQIGISLQIFITKATVKSPISVFINPKIIAKSLIKTPLGQKTTKNTKQKQSKKLEGCLSLVDIWGEVKRNQEVTIEYQDETAKKLKKHYRGFMATIIQHEIDHLSGVLFPKRVLEQKGTLYKSEKDENGVDVFEELKI